MLREAQADEELGEAGATLATADAESDDEDLNDFNALKSKTD